MGIWYLEGKFDLGPEISRRGLSVKSMTIGRDSAAEFPVVSPGISRFHARIDHVENYPVIVDLQSTNGTFVNRQRIFQATRLEHGDVIHLAELEMRVIDSDRQTTPKPKSEEDLGNETVFFSEKELSQTFPTGVRELGALIATRALNMHFQPIYRSATRIPFGYEVLGRGQYPGIPTDPLSLFNIAESDNKEVELSALMRRVGVELAAAHNLQGYIFINTHPAEMKDQETLLASLYELRRDFPDIPLVFEVHEQAIAAVSSLNSFKEELKKIGIRFAFDDFGVGQSRLLELLEAQPDIVKFDRVLIADLDKVDKNKSNLLRRLVGFAKDLSIETLAEGVETAGELQVCEDIGFELYQGYYFARPAPATQFI